VGTSAVELVLVDTLAVELVLVDTLAVVDTVQRYLKQKIQLEEDKAFVMLLQLLFGCRDSE
jgi:hypothetical protein